jgi:2'-5' RNA ligase
MKTYLEIQIPLRSDVTWFEELRNICKNVDVKWQMGYYHITMAFVDDTPIGVDLRPLLEKHFRSFIAPTLTFDKLDAFTAMSGMHIIYLTATEIPQSFVSLVQAIRSDLKSAGCVMKSEFRLHVTLGRVKDPHIQLPKLHKLLEAVCVPAFSMTLTDVDYRVFRGGTIYETRLSKD